MMKVRGMCRIAIVENYSLFCSGIRPVLENLKDITIVAEARKVSDVFKQLRHLKPDILIFDIIHCENNGLPQIKRLKRHNSKLPILLIANKDFSKYFEEYISLGVNGIACTSLGSEGLMNAINSLRNGEDYFPPKVWILLKDYLRTKRKDIIPDDKSMTRLTERELSVLRLFCKGLSYKEIADRLNISPRTVESHKKNITSKIKVRSTAEMVNFAIQNNLS